MSFKEEWGTIWMFPEYQVSDQGRVRRTKFERLLQRTYNQNGIAKVTLRNEEGTTDRAVSHLVAEAFLYKPNPSFNAVIILNQDRDDLRADNLAWRPKWFAIRYNLQCRTRRAPTFVNRIMDSDTGEEFENGFEAAMAYGLLPSDVYLAWANDTVTFPTGQRFEPIE